MEKKFNTSDNIDKFFSNAKAEQNSVSEQSSANKNEYYKFSLKVPIEFKEFLKDTAWQQRTTITQYIVNLIAAEYEKTQKSKENNE